MPARPSVTLTDQLGARLEVPRPVRRIVSLVPSLTEAIASVDRSALVGATTWCTHPADLNVARVRGTKNPDVKAITALTPDVVIAVKEENRELDVRRLRAAGIAVWVADIHGVDDAFRAMRELFTDVLDWPLPGWLREAETLWSGPPKPDELPLRVSIPVWRDPWMVIAGDTFASELAGRLGWVNCFDGAAGRYPHVTLDEIRDAAPDLVLLPDEPYYFHAGDGPEAFDFAPTKLISGRLLTWYGPSLIAARTELRPLTS